MALVVCVPCAAGHCDECRVAVIRGRVTKACSCSHGAALVPIVRTDDPAGAGGSIVGFHLGEDGSLLDTTHAVLVDATEVCRLDNPSDGRVLMALFLEGRVNRTDRRAAFLSLLGADGAASLVAQLLGLAARVGTDFEAEFRAALDAELNLADLWPSTPTL